jgi:hypothetical protein
MRVGELLLASFVLLNLASEGGWAAGDSTPRVGRVSAVVGPVQYQSTTGESSPALVNEPVAAGTGLRAAVGAEAELHGPDARIALAPSTALRVLRLDGDALQIEVSGGRIGVHLDRDNAARTIEIDLPSGGVWLAAPGDYDITAGDEHNPAAVQVFAGKARLGGGLDDRSITAATPDSFNDWWRSQGDNADQATRAGASDVTGAAALDASGRWESDSRLGKVWYPSDIASDWAPYRDGAWRFLSPWGWTWIDNASWGFAPSHYGRWAYIDDRWGWVPGPQLGGGDYSPAAVAFLGTAGYGLSRPGDFNATPAIAWFPLAPGETIGDGNDANYRNRRFATAVSRAVFAGGLPVANALVDDVPEKRFTDAPVILQALGIPPVTTGALAAARKKPAAIALAAASAQTPAPRRPTIVAQREAPPARNLARDGGKRLRTAQAIVLRPRAPASTNLSRSPHNRTHLAAARGGA